ncbi:MAG: lipopolysaccharide biosynthesis protein [Bacteroidota bacterium]|jgi:hypothetical protein
MNTKQELTLKDIVHLAKYWWNYLYSKKTIILSIGLAGMLSGILYAYFSKKVYEAELTFALEEKSGMAGAYAGIASQFGIDIGKSSDGGAFVGDNVMELFKSRLIIENALLQPVQFSNEKELLINRYLKYAKLDEKLASKEETKHIVFTADTDRDNYTRGHDSVLHAVCKSIKKNDLTVSKADKKLNIISLKIKSRDEEFAKHFCELLAAHVRELYIETKISKARRNVELLQQKADSVETLLYREMYGAAASMDQNFNPIRTELRVPYAQKQMHVELLTTVYAELLKNLEISKLTLQKEEPIIQVIDRPIYPLPYEKPGKTTSGILGGIVAALLCILYLIIRKQYTKLMSEA